MTSRRALWALFGGLAGFVLLAAAYDNDPVAAIDRRVAERLADGLPGFVESAAMVASWLGGTPG